LVTPAEKEFVIAQTPKYEDWAIISPKTIWCLFREMHASGEKYIEYEVHDLLKAYYEVWNRLTHTSTMHDPLANNIHN
jgi:hypothetical protein